MGFKSVISAPSPSLRHRRIWSLTLRASLIAADGRRSGNIAMALIFALVALMTAAAVVMRSQGSFMGTLFSTESRDSREAAEYGLRAIISELARTPNRRLLVANQSSSAWVAPSSWATSVSATQNPCAVSSTGTYTPPTDIAGATDAAKASVGTQSDKSYWLKSVAYRNQSSSGARSEVKFERSSASGAWSSSTSGSYSASQISLNGVTRGYIQLQVQGEAVQNGVTSTSLVTKEFELVPKCCGRSFGYTYASLASPSASFGQDLRSCPALGLGVMNLVTGANGDGIFDINGKAFDLWENAIGTNQDQAITLNPADAKQLDSNTNLVGSTQQLPPQLTSPVTFQNSGCISSAVTLPADGLAEDHASACADGTETRTVTETVYQEQSGNARSTTTTTGRGSSRVTTTTYSCNSGEYSVSPNTAASSGYAIPVGAILVDNRNTTITSSPLSTKCYVRTTRTTSTTVRLPYCASSGGDYYCRIRYVNNSGSNNVVIDSSSGPVTLLFTDSAATGRIAGGSASFTGTSGFSHVRSGAAATLSDASRFRVVNNILGSQFELKGASGALSGFFDLRYSDVSLSGGGSNANINLSGILWANDLTLSGNATLVNPPSGNCSATTPAAGSTCGILSSLYPSLFDSTASNDVTRPAYDFTPRSIFSLRMF